jgi:hypothetical protein
VYNLVMGAMGNLQLYVAVGLPTIAVITSLVISLVQISAIREDMRTQTAAMREDMRAQNSAIREDMRAQLGAIREDIREIRSDIKLLTGKVYELMGQK